MKTILVPTDFSLVSTNATTYALEFAKAYAIDSILLFNSYEIPMINEPSLPAIQVMDFDAIQRASMNGLQKRKSELEVIAAGAVKVQCRSEVGGLDEGINDVCKEVQASLIIIGISGASELEERLIGSAATHMINHAEVPLIIVPPDTAFKKIERIVFACNFINVEHGLPLAEITDLLTTTGATLLIVHVDEHRQSPTDLQTQQQVLEQLFASFNPKFFFVENDDFVEGINDFCTEHGADLIITLPRKHGFFDRLFRQHHTRHLAFHTHIPLMCIHENEVHHA